MNFKHIYILIALTAYTCAGSSWAQERWIKVEESRDGSYLVHALRGSYALSSTKNGEQIAVITTKSNNKKNGQVSLEKKYVRTKDCVAEQGKVVSLTMDGDFSYENSFIFGAGSVATSIAETICGIYTMNQQEKDGKGI